MLTIHYIHIKRYKIMLGPMPRLYFVNFLFPLSWGIPKPSKSFPVPFWYWNGHESYGDGGIPISTSMRLLVVFEGSPLVFIRIASPRCRRKFHMESLQRRFIWFHWSFIWLGRTNQEGLMEFENLKKCLDINPCGRWTNYSNPCDPTTPRTPNYQVVFAADTPPLEGLSILR